MIKHIPNLITISRIIGSLLLIPLDPLTSEFFIVYIYCGLSDVVDGFIARKAHVTSELGSKLDSVSDLMFYVIMMLELMPILKIRFPRFIWVYIYALLGLRIAMYVYYGMTKKKIMSNHTILNKISGFLVFLTPFMMLTDYLNIFAIITCTVALIAALYEINISFYGKHLDE
ncbi:MAG: CDP-alcohol phosphatidyltransferase family protein [Erysipelotrichaceae bacterium]|nr:CDP-alcohol phosphatidyltransferase family protein [Erysipelotrichaceae bacterium]